MIVTIIGARPQFIKAAVVSKALAKIGIDECIIHTGQHYDSEMSTVFWEELDMKPYEINFNIGSDTHGVQTGNMMMKIERYILGLEEKPTAMLVYGDTNSTLAGAMVAAKLQIQLIHIESGLRSFNKAMPEEINRIVTDHISDVLFCSSESSITQLNKEGISKNVFCSGDVMFDAVTTFLPIAQKKILFQDIFPFLEGKPYSLLTLHRPSNVDDALKLKTILNSIAKIPELVIWPVHPRTKEKLKSLELPENIHLTKPLSYFEMLLALSSSSKVLTDSGGLQKEAYWLKKPCITLRSETEWIETLKNKWNILANDEKEILDAYSCKIDLNTWKPLYGDCNAAIYIAQTIKSLFS